jgi:hypothetical protein
MQIKTQVTIIKSDMNISYLFWFSIKKINGGYYIYISNMLNHHLRRTNEKGKTYNENVFHPTNMQYLGICYDETYNKSNIYDNRPFIDGEEQGLKIAKEIALFHAFSFSVTEAFYIDSSTQKAVIETIKYLKPNISDSDIRNTFIKMMSERYNMSMQEIHSMKK